MYTSLKGCSRVQKVIEMLIKFVIDKIMGMNPDKLQ